MTVSPVINDEGQRLGTVAELKDHTIEKLAENEVDTILHAAIMGDFSKRIEIQGKEGFFKQLGEGLNELLKTTESGLNDVQLLLYALSHYDLTVTITNDYSGCFAQTRYEANITVKKLKECINQIKEAISALTLWIKKSPQVTHICRIAPMSKPPKLPPTHPIWRIKVSK